MVSVPYRGATFHTGAGGAPDSPEELGFRPLSGSYISQLNNDKLDKKQLRFPSPIGELHFSIIS